MSKAKIAVLASILLLVVLAVYLWQAGSRPQKADPPPGPPEKITISALPIGNAALLLIAKAKGYFQDNGLEASISFFQTGPLGLDQLKAGRIDVAHVADFVLVNEIFKGAKSLRCLGSIAEVDQIHVIVRKDQGILQSGDLRGRRIGVPLGTIAEFFLGRFLTFNNLSLRDVEVVDLHPSEMMEAMANGKVNAVMVWEPYVYEIKNRLGDKVVSWLGQSGQKFHNVLVSSREFIQTRPEALVRLFRTLDQAQTFLKSNREESLEIVAQQLKVDPAILKTEWLQGEYELSFDQSLVITMEDQARWMINNKLTDQTRLPDFLDYFYVETLAKVNPKAVQVIIPKDERPVAPAPTAPGQERR
jgi:NitT/TauT family transport system substrate-binding protein